MFPDWMLERFLLGELDAPTTRRLEAALAAEPALQARVDALRADSLATLAGHPPELVARVVARRLAAAPGRRHPWRLALLPALAGAAGLLWVTLAPGPAAPGDDLRLKGDGPTLSLFRLGPAGPERLVDGTSVRRGEVVQVAFDLAGQRSLVVVSLDGTGSATLHYPPGDDARAPPGLKALPQSFELDDAPGFERFFLVTSDRPLSALEVLAAARRLGQTAGARGGPLPVPEGATVRSVRLDKVAP
jgi:hypothetical protein